MNIDAAAVALSKRTGQARWRPLRDPAVIFTARLRKLATARPAGTRVAGYRVKFNHQNDRIYAVLLATQFMLRNVILARMF
jgi:hypothetical protein